MAAVRGHAPLSEWVAALDALADAAAKTAQHQAGGRSVYAAGAAGAAGGSHGTLSVAKRAVGFSSVGRGAEASRKASTAASKASRWRKEAPKAAAEKAVLLKRRSFAEDLVERLTAGRRRDAKLAKAGVARPPPASGTASSASQGNGKSITTGIASAQPSPAARAAPSAAAPTSLRAPQTCSTTAAFLREESPRPALDARPRRAKGASPRQRSNSPSPAAQRAAHAPELHTTGRCARGAAERRRQPSQRPQLLAPLAPLLAALLLPIPLRAQQQGRVAAQLRPRAPALGERDAGWVSSRLAFPCRGHGR